MNKRKKGFALMTVLIFFLVLLILGVGGAIITQIGYFSIASEAKYSVAEKNANKGLLTVLESGICTDSTSGTFLNGYTVIAKKDDGYNYCFVWSEGRYLGAKVIKTSIFQAIPWAAATFKNLDSLNLSGSSAIVGHESCDDFCRGFALAMGNLTNPNWKIEKDPCKKNPQGLTSIKDPPYILDETLLQTDLTSKLFNARNRDQLLQSLRDNFSVEFGNGTDNGTPIGLVNGTSTGEDPVITLNVTNCNATGITITCGEDKFTWENGKYTYNKNGTKSSKIDLGNATITFEDFTGGGYIAGNNISFSGNVNATSPLILVARNEITISQNNIEISKTFMFSQNYNIDAQNLTIENGIIYSGGEGGKLNIDQRSNSKLGTQENPILIISDNSINIAENGNVEVYGAIFLTDANTTFNLEGNGNFKIHGIIISNSPNENSVNLKGNFEVRFNFKVLENLYDNLSQFNLLRPPLCSRRNFFITTTMKTY
uniref:Type 4 fimbrial biogenesis protein PilX N-terminal domain-containing protein n=1 Tax=Thermodesulfobacterium geofontis TaxID=1295609 RepID=A0A7V5XHV1_9BACT